MSDTLLIDAPRLHIRPLTMADFEFYYLLQCDPDTMRYIRPPEPDRAVVQERVQTLEQYGAAHPGLGSKIAFEKETQVPVATCVLRHVDYQPENELELGYIIVPEFRGRGLATEITRALAAYAFQRFAVPHVVAVTDPDNLSSQNVLLKCGFQAIGRRFIYGSECLEFRLNNPAHFPATDR